MSKRPISRRRFIQTGFVCFAGAATNMGSFQRITLNKETAGVSRTSLKTLRAIPTSCEQCPAGCGVIAYLDGDRIVQILGNPIHPINQGGICAKGVAGLNLVKDPERVFAPLKRTGARGKGQWTKITWDEVYTILSNRINTMIRDGKTKELVIDMGKNDPLLDLLISAIGPTHVIERSALKNLNRDKAFFSMTGAPWLVADVGRSHTVFNFGANPFANHDQFLGITRRLINAQIDKGAKLITFDVRMSETAAKSDAWYPVKAGTDGLVALAMARVIVEKGLADKDFMAQKTNSSLSKLKHHLSAYTLEVAERESGIRASDIEGLAIEFATQKPSLAIIGGGAFDHENGTQNALCVALLNWLVGNLEKKGGLFFPRFPGNFQQKAPQFSEEWQNSKNPIKGIMELLQADSQIDTYFVYFSNPAYDTPDCKPTARILEDEKRVPFLVVMDTHLTETAMLADMVLPAATYLEGWGIKIAPSLDGYPIINLRQPVVSLLSAAEALRSPEFDVGKLLEPSFQPLGESKEIGTVSLELARRIGGKVSKSLPFKNTQEYIAKAVTSILIHKKQTDFKDLKRAGLWIDKTPKKAKKPIPTPSQKVEIYSSTMKENGHSPLPEYLPIPMHKEKKENEFILTTFKSNLRAIGTGTTNSKWVREILHENRLWINKESAEKLGIKNNDRVRVISSVGTLITRVLTTGRIHPDSVAMAEGMGHTAVGKVAKAQRFKSIDQDTDLIWWDKEGNGVNPNEIIERRKDPIGGSLASKDTVVKIKRINE